MNITRINANQNHLYFNIPERPKIISLIPLVASAIFTSAAIITFAVAVHIAIPITLCVAGVVLAVASAINAVICERKREEPSNLEETPPLDDKLNEDKEDLKIIDLIAKAGAGDTEAQTLLFIHYDGKNDLENREKYAKLFAENHKAAFEHIVRMLIITNDNNSDELKAQSRSRFKEEFPACSNISQKVFQD